MEVIAELGTEIAHEVRAEWVTLLIELVQFGILVFIIKAVAFGMGKRTGMVTNMLSSRTQRIADRLQEAATREADAVEAPNRALEIVAQAQQAREFTLAEAHDMAAAERKRVLAEAEAQAAELAQQAEDTLVHEREEVLGGVRDVLLDVVAQSTRQVLDEGYSAGQQREMIESAILESLGDLESVAIN